jgi:putative sterol carrier protein
MPDPTPPVTPENEPDAVPLAAIDPSTDPSTVDPTAVDPLEFANMVRTASDEQLEAGLAVGRELILGEIFRRMAEHFDPEAAAGVDAVIDWRITGRENGGHDFFRVVIRDGACHVGREGEGEAPRVALELPAVTFVRIVTGNLFGAAVYLSGELQVEGDVGFAMMVQRFFRIPQPSASA